MPSASHASQTGGWMTKEPCFAPLACLCTHTHTRAHTTCPPTHPHTHTHTHATYSPTNGTHTKQPRVARSVMAELEKLGRKYRLALQIAKDPRFERLPCMHKGTYADDCIVNRIKEVCAAERDVAIRACVCVLHWYHERTRTQPHRDACMTHAAAAAAAAAAHDDVDDVNAFDCWGLPLNLYFSFFLFSFFLFPFFFSVGSTSVTLSARAIAT